MSLAPDLLSLFFEVVLTFTSIGALLIFVLLFVRLCSLNRLHPRQPRRRRYGRGDLLNDPSIPMSDQSNLESTGAGPTSGTDFSSGHSHESGHSGGFDSGSSGGFDGGGGGHH
jgi:uncharacterized membrane protein YgcG